MTYEEACRAVLNSHKTNGYAKNYARAGLQLGSDEAKRVQALYIYSNITYWRGETSKEVRNFLKQYGEKK